MPPQLRIALWLLLAAFGGFVATGVKSMAADAVASQRTLEGAVFQQLVFRDGTRKVAYEQPRGWNVSGGGASILFTPPDVSQAQARIDQTPLQQPQTFDEATAKLLQEQALTFLPPNSQNPAVVGEERNAILIDGQATYEVTMQYLFYGEEYEMSVLFVNIGDTQLRCQVIAKKNDFPKIHTLFRGSLCSLQWL